MVVSIVFSLLCISQLLNIFLSWVGDCRGSVGRAIQCHQIPDLAFIVDILSFGDSFGLAVLTSLVLGFFVYIISACFAFGGRLGVALKIIGLVLLGLFVAYLALMFSV